MPFFLRLDGVAVNHVRNCGGIWGLLALLARNPSASLGVIPFREPIPFSGGKRFVGATLLVT